MDELDQKYLEFAEMFNDVTNMTRTLSNKKKALRYIRQELNGPDSDGGFATDISAHAFAQISERLEALAMEYPAIHKDIFRPDNTQDSLMLPSNMKSFIITTIAQARSKGLYKKESGKNSRIEFRYTIEMKSWSAEKSLVFVAIVENNNIKTGYFNWV
jgi:hypothetical protein